MADLKAYRGVTSMGHKFADLLFSDSVKALQKDDGSRSIFETWEARDDYNHILGERETNFLRERNSFYLASVSPDGWPYIQHRGGPKGFIKILQNNQIGFADYKGNRQHISAGNLRVNDRVACFFMDYSNRRRLKMLGTAKTIEASDLSTLKTLEDKTYPASIERGFVIQVLAFDWNCSQHIPVLSDKENR